MSKTFVIKLATHKTCSKDITLLFYLDSVG